MSIFKALIHNNFYELISFVKKNPKSVYETNSDGDTALHLACWAKNFFAINLLLDSKSDPNFHGNIGRTALHYAVCEGNEYTVPIIKLLITHGANPRLMDDDENTPLDYAATEIPEQESQIADIFENPDDHRIN